MSNSKHRAIIVVLDSLGVGELPDAIDFGDSGSNTLGHIAESRPLNIPNLQRLGMANIIPLKNIDSSPCPQAAWGKMRSASKGKDTTSGHWEMAGLVLKNQFPLFPQGFPAEVIEPFCQAINRSILGNYAASGTQIIEDLGPEHARTGKPIIYTSGDSVFQVAAHEEVIPLVELYEICEKARSILQGPYGVGRVIARPFIGKAGAYVRTNGRRDFSLAPPPGGLLDKVLEKGLEMISVGKISDIFNEQGISRAIEAHDNNESYHGVLSAMQEDNRGLIFANFVDFDSLYGHRNNVEGYANAIESFDKVLPDIEACLKDDDILFLTSDHGNDPTYPGTDHTREYAFILACGKKIKPVSIGERATFADLGATIAEYLGLQPLPLGTSFLNQILA